MPATCWPRTWPSWKPAESFLARASDAVTARLNASLDDLGRLPLVRTAAVLLGDAATVDLPRLDQSRSRGALAALAKADIGFRVGVSDAHQRELMIKTIASHTGWANRPDDWDLNLTRRSGAWIAEIGMLHHSRRFGRFRRRPWSTNPVLAAIMVRLAKPAPNQHLHDPFCGTGTLLIMAGRLVQPLRLTGTDNDPATLALARDNLRDHGVVAEVDDADAIPFRCPDASLDRVLSNLPFGKQVGSHANNIGLYPAVARELARTLRPDGRAVLLTEDKRLLADAVARTRGIKIIRERLFRYNGATPTAYTITRTRRS